MPLQKIQLNMVHLVQKYTTCIPNKVIIYKHWLHVKLWPSGTQICAMPSI